MSILYSYLGYILGELTFVDDCFCYTSNVDGEQAAKQASFGLMTYKLYNSHARKSSNLFDEFKVWIHCSSRKDIAEFCDINSFDSDWEKLVKMAKYNLENDGFSLKIAGK